MTLLTQKRRRFCQFIISGANQTEAAIKSGYKEKSAKAIGSQLMAMPEIKDYIEELKKLDTKYEGSPPILEDVDLALVCKDPVEKLIQLMNCKDDLIEMTAAKALLPYFYLKKIETDTPNRIGKKELKEVTAIKATEESKFSTLGNQLTNTYEHNEDN